MLSNLSFRSAGSASNKDKYPMDDIKDSTSYTLVYIKCRTIQYRQD
jgi:hypothetical protein